MKKIASFLLVLVAGLSFISATPALAENAPIIIADKPHQLFNGTFRDDELATSLLPDGKLGSRVFSPPRGINTWVIDGRLLDEVAAMTDGYILENKKEGVGALAAKSWLTRLALSTGGDHINALAYGNPDIAIARSLAPSEFTFYLAYGKTEVEKQLKRKVTTDQLTVTGTSNMSALLKKDYTQSRQSLSKLSTVIYTPEVEAVRANLSVVLNPFMKREDREVFTNDAVESVMKYVNKLRVTNGQYQLTSKEVKVPITLTNDFDSPVTLFLTLSPQNSRVQVGSEFKVTIAAKSRSQLAVPFTVIAPGATTVIAQFTNDKGQKVGKEAVLTLNLSIFDSRVAWFTSGAGILLLLAAITQTVRRIRRSRA
ncbi:unannotated protein [freshwater metagenome]|uniref:Unannotated protein n=1 Tax=freshwater metagenome TaxID=449393 RepID=A0A6J7DWJ7_9ZZZZ|nr:hypothetical protein [Actinomycetota bacterium]